MRFSKFILIVLFYCGYAFPSDYQYLLSPYFYINPHSYQINGMQRISFNIGEIFDSAAKEIKDREGKNIFTKCAAGKKSSYIFYLYPASFYNPGMTTFYTDLDVRIFEAPGKFKSSLKISYQTYGELFENSKKNISNHYKELIRKLILENQENTPNFKIDGSFCEVLE